MNNATNKQVTVKHIFGIGCNGKWERKFDSRAEAWQFLVEQCAKRSSKGKLFFVDCEFSGRRSAIQAVSGKPVNLDRLETSEQRVARQDWADMRRGALGAR